MSRLSSRPCVSALMLLALSACLTLAAGAASTPTPADTASYGDTYTPEELAALDTALYAVNMDRTDLRFKKDYTKGLDCFPVVRAMMDDPLSIAVEMDKLASAVSESGLAPSLAAVIAAARLGWGEDHVMLYEEWRTCSEWAFSLSQPGGMEDWTPDYVQTLVETDYVHFASTFEQDQPAYDALRLKLPGLMAWHDTFAHPADLDEARIAEIEKWIEAQPRQWYMAKLDASYYNSTGLVVDYLLCFSSMTEWARALSDEFFPTDKPLVMQTKAGAVVIGTTGDDTYEGLDCAFVIEPGGNDTYLNCRLAGVHDPAIRTTAAFLDMGGDDVYDCASVDITLGAAVLGAALFCDLGAGNDRYLAGNCSLGAAMGGIATFYDDGGSDYYSGKAYTQGAAGFGIGVMIDDSVQPAPTVPTDVETPDPILLAAFDNDYYTAWTNAQAFARTRGIALCINRRGNEVYHAGGVYLDAPLFSDRYQSFSQGFAIGERDIDYAGGIAMLIDYSGNDRYLGDIYNQGVGYWYSAGLLWDGGGNDSYEMTQYGQGSGIHLAIGGLVDAGGNDTYVMHSGLGQGGSHDFAASVLMDRGGNDHYMGLTSCNGTGLTNSVGMFFDRSGDDIYAGRRDGMMNGGRPDRNTGSIGIFVDLAGTDDYLSKVMKDASVWSQTFYGAGVDIAPPPQPEGQFPSEGAANVVSGQAPIPEVCKYEGELTQVVFDELWEISIRWEVGDNRYIVPEARKRLIAFGPPVIPYLDGKMDNDASGLAQRAFVDILKALMEQAPDQVADLLRRNTTSDNDTRRNVALYLIGELKPPNIADAVVPLLDSPDPAFQRRAIGVLGLLGSHAADDRLIAMLDPSGDEALIRVAMTTLTDLEVDCYPQLRPLLSHPMVTVREALINQLGKHWNLYEDGVSADLAATVAGGSSVPVPAGAQALPTRALRSVLVVLAREADAPGVMNAVAVDMQLDNPDWGVRADAVRVVRHWQDLSSKGTKLPQECTTVFQHMRDMLAKETDPYVLSVGS